MNRQLTLYLNEKNEDDQPFDYKELIHLGIHLDFYIIFIKNHSEWIMSKLKFRCLKFSAFDKYPCTSQILSPLHWISHQQSTFSTTEFISTTEIIRKEIKSSTNFILFILFILWIEDYFEFKEIMFPRISNIHEEFVKSAANNDLRQIKDLLKYGIID
ncbi:unnamed protein product, partial [Adineta ricciae]